MQTTWKTNKSTRTYTHIKIVSRLIVATVGSLLLIVFMCAFLAARSSHYFCFVFTSKWQQSHTIH